MTRYDRPFYDDPWVGEQAQAAAAVWDWHEALRTSAETSTYLDQEDFLLEAERVRVEMTTRLVDASVTRRAKVAVDRLSLDPNLFAAQLETAHLLKGPINFVDYGDLQSFADGWAVPLGRLLLAVAGSNRRWQIGWADSLSRGFFLLGRLLHLPIDVQSRRVFLPRDEMVFFGVSDENLRSGPPEEPVRKLLWKQCVRIRDQFAQSLPLASELPRKQAAAYKRWWLGGLEVVNTIERKRYDLWNEPMRLSRFHRAQVRYQARFSRLSFKK